MAHGLQARQGIFSQVHMELQKVCYKQVAMKPPLTFWQSRSGNCECMAGQNGGGISEGKSA